MRRGQSLRDKIVKINMFFFSSVLIILFTLFFSYWYKIENNNNKKDLDTIANVKANQLYDKLLSMDRTALQLVSDPYIANDLFKGFFLSPTEGNVFENDRILNNKIITHIIPYILNDSITSRICLFNDSNDFVFVGEIVDNVKTQNYFNNIDIIPAIEKLSAGDFLALIPPRKDPFYYNKFNSKEKIIISIVREVIDYSNAESDKVGYVEVQQTLEKLSQMFEDLDSSISFEIKDTDDNIILNSSTPYSKTNLEISVPIKDYGYTLIIKKDNKYFVTMTYLLGAALLIMLSLLILGIRTTENFVIKTLTKPLDELQSLVNTIDIGNMDFSFKMDGEIDQIQHLESAFREMLIKLKDSIDDKVEARTEELRSHLFALQAQMNPHFIHNMMAVISSIAEEYDATEIEDICVKLSSIIRYTVQFNQADIALEDEVKHAQNYLDLMHIRYEDQIVYSISEGFQTGIKVPKFFLQPLVENCFKHGFLNSPSPWNIHIDIIIEETIWKITITDNGSGFSDKILKTIENLLLEVKNSRADEILKNLQIGGMGLRNVFARLYLNYKEKMIFNISNRSDTPGAIVEIGGPK
ncbi:MAG: histidine kinase [Spirochaetaceae bacterium]